MRESTRCGAIRGMEMSQTKMKESPAAQLAAPRYENGKPLLITGIRAHYASAPWEGIPTQWQRLASHLGKIPGKLGRTTYGLNFLLPNGVDYLSGVEASGNAGFPSEFTTVSIPAQKYVVFPHSDHVSKLNNTCQLAYDWLTTSGHEAARSVGAPDFFELYTEEFNPRTGMGGIEVWVPIKA